MASIGRVLLKPKGDYSSSATYNNLDWVRYNGKAWVCKVNGTINVTPTEGQNWTLLAQDGSGGGGGASDWDDINYKPFDTLDTTNDFTVDSQDNNKLHIKRDTYGTIRVVSGGTTTNLEASGDSVFEIDAGTNVTINADDTANPKKITINSSGGGGGATWGSITGTLSSQTDLKNALDAKEDASSLGDLAYIDTDGASSTKFLQGDGTWQNPPAGGHQMLPDPTVDPSTLVPPKTVEQNAVDAVSGGRVEGYTNDDVPSLNTISYWSNTMTKTFEIKGKAGSSTRITQSGIGTWPADPQNPTAAELETWIPIRELYGIWSSGDDVHFKLGFHLETVSVPITLGGYYIDDNCTMSDGQGGTIPCGRIVIKFGNEIPEADTHTAIISVEMTIKRTDIVEVG